MTSTTDRIEKKVLLEAPLERVWRAISDAKEFGAWFGVRFDGPFVAGAPITGRITPTTVDPEIGAKQEPFAGMSFEIRIDRIEAERHLSFRWHPFAVDGTVDYSGEPMTRVTFDLEEVPGGTMLTVRETGFDALAAERRAKAFESNEQGWAAQMVLITKYLSRAA